MYALDYILYQTETYENVDSVHLDKMIGKSFGLEDEVGPTPTDVTAQSKQEGTVISYGII